MLILTWFPDHKDTFNASLTPTGEFQENNNSERKALTGPVILPSRTQNIFYLKKSPFSTSRGGKKNRFMHTIE